MPRRMRHALRNHSTNFQRHPSSTGNRGFSIAPRGRSDNRTHAAWPAATCTLAGVAAWAIVPAGLRGARLIVCFIMQNLGDFRVGPQIPRHALEGGGVQSVRSAAQLGWALGFPGGHGRVHARARQNPHQREAPLQVTRQILVGRLTHGAAPRCRARARAASLVTPAACIISAKSNKFLSGPRTERTCHGNLA